MIELYRGLNMHDVTIYLYGELIPTQKRIKYVEHCKSYFIAFNLRIVSYENENNDEIEASWYPKEIWIPIATSFGFLVIPTLFEGTLAECSNYDVEHNRSCVPQLINPLSTLSSPIEGIVIKGPHMTLKKKAVAFREMEVGGGIRISLQKQENPDIVAVEEIFGSMMTKARLDNIVSQIGDKMVEDAKRLSLATANDAIREMKDDLDSPIHKINPNKLNKMKNEFTKLFIDTVKEHMNWK